MQEFEGYLRGNLGYVDKLKGAIRITRKNKRLKRKNKHRKSKKKRLKK
jgi:hypothetical protein